MLNCVDLDFVALSGPFSSCHEYVNPDDYYDSCVYDVCLTGEEALCASLAQYARACRSKDGAPGRWRLAVDECRKSIER